MAKAILTALLSLALQKSDFSSTTEPRFLPDLEQSTTSDPASLNENIRAGFLADLELEGFEQKCANLDNLASNIKDNLLLKEYTKVCTIEQRDSCQGL
jgi:hypothetical protein